MGSDKVRPALSLVDYDSDVQPAMEYVFGTTFVCNTLQDAKQVGYTCTCTYMYVQQIYVHRMSF